MPARGKTPDPDWADKFRPGQELPLFANKKFVVGPCAVKLLLGCALIFAVSLLAWTENPILAKLVDKAKITAVKLSDWNWKSGGLK